MVGISCKLTHKISAWKGTLQAINLVELSLLVEIHSFSESSHHFIDGLYDVVSL